MEIVNLSLKERWQKLKKNNSHLRIRNAAEILGVSEAELLICQIGDSVILLKSEIRSLLGEIESLGKVMALTRNNEVVHERKGVYLNPSLDNLHVGLFAGEDIDLRLFFQPWKYVFAVQEGEGKTLRQSFQFFASDGEAMHKIYLTSNSDVNQFHLLVEKYKADNQYQELIFEECKNDFQPKQDNEIDVNNFQKDWIELKDTHHFFGLLKKYGLERTQALRLAPEGNYAIKVNNNITRLVLMNAADKNIEIMVFVGNKGVIQIHTGLVKKIVDHENWLNVLDPDFNLHVKENEIFESWIVRKPTEDGIVTAVEIFNSKGEQIIQLFGKRKPGIPELKEWSLLVEQIEKFSKLQSTLS